MARELFWQVERHQNGALTLHITENEFTIMAGEPLRSNPDHGIFYRALAALLAEACAKGDSIKYFDWNMRPKADKQ